MSYRLQSSRRKHTGRDFFRVIIVLAVLAIAYFFFRGPIASALHSVQKGVGYVFGYYDETVRPMSENSLLQSVRLENDQLKEMLGRKPEHDDRLLAVILSRPPKVPFDSLVIDVGEDHDINPGDLVYGEMDYLIGHVDAVYAKSAVAKLFSSPGEKVDVLLGSSTTPVVAEGRGGGNFYIKVPKNIMVLEGDQIIIPGINPVVLGTAEKVDSDEGEAFSYVYFKLPVLLNSLHYVQIKKAVR